MRSVDSPLEPYATHRAGPELSQARPSRKPTFCASPPCSEFAPRVTFFVTMKTAATLTPSPSGKQKVLIASDHAALELKAALQSALPDFSWEDLGPQTASSVDYPDYAEKLCEKLNQTPGAFGILLCGSGIGMSIAANKIAGIRAALVENPVSARLAREHNDANVLCLGARFVAPAYASEIAKVFLTTESSTDSRHTGRIEKIKKLE